MWRSEVIANPQQGVALREAGSDRAHTPETDLILPAPQLAM
jgi:hypothetical protein